MDFHFILYWYDKKTEELAGSKQLAAFSEENARRLLNLPSDEDDCMMLALAEAYQLEVQTQVYNYFIGAQRP